MDSELVSAQHATHEQSVKSDEGPSTKCAGTEGRAATAPNKGVMLHPTYWWHIENRAPSHHIENLVSPWRHITTMDSDRGLNSATKTQHSSQKCKKENKDLLTIDVEIVR